MSSQLPDPDLWLTLVDWTPHEAEARAELERWLARHPWVTLEEVCIDMACGRGTPPEWRCRVLRAALERGEA